jgi:CRP-like cAMP-binding protein
MLINTDVLIAWGGKSRKFKKHEFVFLEDQEPRWFYQIQTGKVRMLNINPDGKEFTQGVFGPGDSFGEPPLVIQEPFPASAVTMEESVISMLPRDTFFRILQEYPDIQEGFMKLLSRRIYEKSISARSIVNCKPEIRIQNFLSQERKRLGVQSGKALIACTRQEIANSTGLRVETVIRTLNQMEKKKLVEIQNHKLYY